MKRILTLMVLVLFLSTNVIYAGQFQQQGQLQGQKQNSSLNFEDKRDYFLGAPALPAMQGVDSLNAYTPFGGFGISDTAEHEYATIRLNMIGALYSRGVISEEVARVKALEAWDQLEDATKPNRFLGFLWKTRGKNLSNLMGLLSWRSFRKE